MKSTKLLLIILTTAVQSLSASFIDPPCRGGDNDNRDQADKKFVRLGYISVDNEASSTNLNADGSSSVEEIMDALVADATSTEDYTHFCFTTPIKAGSVLLNSSSIMGNGDNASHYVAINKKVKDSHPNIKTLITIDIDGVFQDKNNGIAESLDDVFVVDSLVDFLRMNHFDGINLDLSSPVTGASSAVARARQLAVDISALLTEKRHIEEESSSFEFELTATVHLSPEDTDNFVFQMLDLKGLAQYVDWFNIVLLHEKPHEEVGASKFEKSIQFLGIPSHQLVLDLAIFDDTFSFDVANGDDFSSSIERLLARAQTDEQDHEHSCLRGLLSSLSPKATRSRRSRRPSESPSPSRHTRFRSPTVVPTGMPTTTPSATPSTTPSVTPSREPAVSRNKRLRSPTVPTTTPSATPSTTPSVTPSREPAVSRNKRLRSPTVPTTTPSATPS
eukprot:CAMPEP_0116015044 /NCGR_PEP_ID=MMETSP0321-20121206/6614_1 /TAXON_ID=163516 /ORGANISM="Leptocylindrus danicus var. danicus, Strain B650" /LENGTH=446 /DNA_ID=CAMNT_0003484763 /DNA_START=67 /DNA_END=1403 /DNA_ORIENTATION=-